MSFGMGRDPMGVRGLAENEAAKMDWSEMPLENKAWGSPKVEAEVIMAGKAQGGWP